MPCMLINNTHLTLHRHVHMCMCRHTHALYEAWLTLLCMCMQGDDVLAIVALFSTQVWTYIYVCMCVCVYIDLIDTELDR